MAVGITALRRVQIGRETVLGTPVPATHVWLGELSMVEEPTLLLPKLHTGRLAEFDRQVTAKRRAALTFEGDASFDQLPIALLMAVRGGITPTTPPTATTARLWSFTPLMTASNTPTSFTVEYGNNVQAWESEYCVASRMELSGAADEAIKLALDMFGRRTTIAPFTAGLTVPLPELALSKRTELRIADTLAALPTSPLMGTLVDFSAVLETQFHPVDLLDGTELFGRVSEAKRHLELSMTIEFEARAVTERAAYMANTPRFIQLRSRGSVIETTFFRELVLELCGVYTEWETLDERDGADVVGVKLVSIFDAGLTADFLFRVQNTISTI